VIRDGGRALRVVSGEASAEEIAAVVAAVAAAVPDAEGDGAAGDAGSTSIWAVPVWAPHPIGAALAPGPDAWRTSFWPR
jgi:hypothetical protein